MRTTHRPYSEETGDFFRLCRFIRASRRNDGWRQSLWSMGRIVDWKYGLYANKRRYADFCAENACLWFDGFDDLAGFALSEGGDAGFHIQTLPGYRFLYEEILDWVLAAWQARIPALGAALSTELTECQALEAAALQRRGFESKSAFVTRRFDLTQPLAPRAPLEPGFVIVDMHAHPDYEAQGRLRADAFEGQADPTPAQMQTRLTFYNHTHRSPLYHAPTDLCVMAPDGRLVAGAEALIDAHNAEADVERVCTHSAYRQRGFARAVTQECLHRLRALGLGTAYITGYSPEAIALYGALSPAEPLTSFVYAASP
jgi:ribosomal protein S18 acetylase RimI-like enzyme